MPGCESVAVPDQDVYANALRRYVLGRWGSSTTYTNACTIQTSRLVRYVGLCATGSSGPPKAHEEALVAKCIPSWSDHKTMLKNYLRVIQRELKKNLTFWSDRTGKTLHPVP
jgi:hypothetical protein